MGVLARVGADVRPVSRGGRSSAYRKLWCRFHEDTHPSFHVYPTPAQGWHCFSCRTGGSIYDLAAALWDLEPRGVRVPAAPAAARRASAWCFVVSVPAEHAMSHAGGGLVAAYARPRADTPAALRHGGPAAMPPSPHQANDLFPTRHPSGCRTRGTPRAPLDDDPRRADRGVLSRRAYIQRLPGMVTPLTRRAALPAQRRVSLHPRPDS